MFLHSRKIKEKSRETGGEKTFKTHTFASFNKIKNQNYYLLDLAYFFDHFCANYPDCSGKIYIFDE